MAESSIVAGATFTIRYPFVQERVTLSDEGYSYEILSWRPGTPSMHQGYADGEGQQLLRVIAVATLGGRYQDRVFYRQEWIDPDGKRFGNIKARLCTLRTFRRMLQGYAFRYSLPGQPSVWEQAQAEYAAVRAESSANVEQDQREGGYGAYSGHEASPVSDHDTF